jgi:hypothetical protein
MRDTVRRNQSEIRNPQPEMFTQLAPIQQSMTPLCAR